MATDQQTLNVQGFAKKLAEELQFAAQVGSTSGLLTGKQITDCASDVLRIDFRCTDTVSAIKSLPASIRPFLLHAADSPKDRVNVLETIKRFEKIARGEV